MKRPLLLLFLLAAALLAAPACQRIPATQIFPESVDKKKASKQERLQEIERLNESPSPSPSFFSR